MFCRVIAETIEKSQFTATARGGAYLDHTKALGLCMSSRGQSLADAQATLEKAYEDAKSKQIQEELKKEEKDEKEAVNKAGLVWNFRPIATVRLSDRAARVLERSIRVFQGPQGPEWLIRTGEEGMSFGLAISPIIGLRQSGVGANSPYGVVKTALSGLHLTAQMWTYQLLDEQTGAVVSEISQTEYARLTVDAASKEPFFIALELDRTEMLNKIIAITTVDIAQDKASKMAEVAHHCLPEIETILGPTGGMGNAAYLSEMIMHDPRFFVSSLPKVITNDAAEVAFTYVNTTKFMPGPTPAFDGWLERVEDGCRELFMALIYAPLDAKARHRKVCWIKSDGYDGKSTFFRAYDKYTGGKLVGNVNTHSLTSDFGLESTIGKRILVMADSQNRHLLSTNAIHNITGGDNVLINRKGQTHINYRYEAMVFVGSNDAPEIHLHLANAATRIAYIPMTPPTDAQLKKYALVLSDGTIARQSDGTPIYTGSNFEEELVAEMPHILYKCRKMYEKMAPAGSEIMVPKKAYDIMLRDCASLASDDFAVYASKYLEFDSRAETPYSDLVAHYSRIKKVHSNSPGLVSFKRWLESHGVVIARRRIHSPGSKLRITTAAGVKIKEE